MKIMSSASIALPPREGRAYGAISSRFHGFLQWYQTAVIAVALLVVYLNLPIYAYVVRPDFLPKYFYYFLFFFFAPFLLIKPKALASYMLSPFALWGTTVIILCIIHLLSSSLDGSASQMPWVDRQDEVRDALILNRIQYILFSMFLGFAVFVHGKQSYLYTFVMMAVVLPCTLILDFLMPGLLYPVDTPGAVLGRAAAMFINPTMAAEAALLVYLFSCASANMKFRGLLFILLGAGLLVTFTRSALIAWMLLLVILMAKRILPKSAIFATAITLALFLFSFSAFESYLANRQDFEGAVSNVQARLNFFSNAKLDDDSSQERAEVVRAGWKLFLENPVFGAGAGATHFWEHRASTHNQLLMLAAEHGIFGIALWIWLAVILWKGKFFQNRSLQFVTVFLFVFMSMFTHLMFDSATYWLATFALASGKRSQGQTFTSREDR